MDRHWRHSIEAEENGHSIWDAKCFLRIAKFCNFGLQNSFFGLQTSFFGLQK
jgi:hypothetical protein